MRGRRVRGSRYDRETGGKGRLRIKIGMRGDEWGEEGWLSTPLDVPAIATLLVSSIIISDTDLVLSGLYR